MTPAQMNSAPATVFAVKQRFTPVVNRYEILPADAEGNPTGPMFAFAQQKRMKLKEEVVFYSDDAKTAVVFSFKSRNVLDVHGMTDIFDPQGTAIGMFRKDFKASLLRSTWHVSAAGGSETRGQERSALVAVLRRFTDVTFIPYHFDFTWADGTVAFSVEKRWGVRDRYKISVWDTSIDWRVIAAMAVALDALQGR
jgi:uncharacterized protein YxjI